MEYLEISSEELVNFTSGWKLIFSFIYATVFTLVSLIKKVS